MVGLALAVLAATASRAQIGAGPSRTFQPGDLFSLQQASDPESGVTAALSPMSAKARTS